MQLNIFSVLWTFGFSLSSCCGYTLPNCCLCLINPDLRGFCTHALSFCKVLLKWRSIHVKCDADTTPSTLNVVYFYKLYDCVFLLRFYISIELVCSDFIEWTFILTGWHKLGLGVLLLWRHLALFLCGDVKEEIKFCWMQLRFLCVSWFYFRQNKNVVWVTEFG